MLPTPAFSPSPFLRRIGLGLLVFLCIMTFALAKASACRMVTVVQTVPNAERVKAYWVDHSRSLMNQSHASEPFYQTAGQSLNTNFVEGVVPTVDGVGIVGFDADAQFLKSLYFRQSEPLFEGSNAFKENVSSLGEKSTVLMGHVRARTTGEVTPFNNHPFVATLNAERGGTWAFMANGGTQISAEDYTRLVKDKRLLTARSKAPTMTDSEKLFHVLITPLLPLIDTPPIDGDGFNLGKIEYIASSLAKSYGETQGKIEPKVMKPFVKGGGYSDAYAGNIFNEDSLPVIDEDSYFLRYTPKTWVMSNGAYTFIFVHGYEQWYQINYGGEDRSYASGIIFASEPTNIKEYYANGEAFLNEPDAGFVQGSSTSRWQQLPQDSLTVVYNSGQGIRMRIFPVVIPQMTYPNVHVYSPKKGHVQGKGSGVAVPPASKHPTG